MKEHIDDDALDRAISKWEETVPIEDAFSQRKLYQHLENEWGLMIYDQYTKYTPSDKRVLLIRGLSTCFIVIDEGKYLMFMLKFS